MIPWWVWPIVGLGAWLLVTTVFAVLVATILSSDTDD